MFQNIAEGNIQNDKEKVKLNNKIWLICKELFKFQNIVIYVITLLISMISIREAYIPLGLAMVAACLGSTVPIFLVYIVALIGTGIGLGNSALVSFFYISILYFIFIALFKPKICTEERNEVYKTGSRLFWAYMVSSVIKNWTSNIWLADLFYAAVYAGIMYVFYKIFVNGIVVIKDYMHKKAFTIEEMVGATVIISLACSIFANIQIYQMSLCSIIIIFMIMVLGWKNGMLVGATSGIAIGLTTSFVQATDLITILIFSISGILAGFLNKFGKPGVIIGFVLGNLILNHMVADSVNLIVAFREIFIASIGLLLVPKNIKLDIEDLIGKTKLLDNRGETRLEDKERITNKLSELYKILEDTFPKKEENTRADRFDRFEELFLDNLEELVDNIFYDDLISTESTIVKDIYKVIEENDIILEENMIEIFKANNNYIIMKDENIKNDLREIIKIVNRSYKMLQMEDLKHSEAKNAKEKITKAVEEVSKAIDKCVTEISDTKNKTFEQKEKELKTILKSKKIPVQNIFIRQVKNGKFIVDIYLDILDNTLREKNRITNIADLISKNLGSRMSFQRDKKRIEKGEYVQTYSSEDKYIMQVGSSKISKDDSKTSGDSNLQMRLEDGKYILAISDGMGTGELARENSKIVIKKLKSLIENGFEKEDSINLINSTLNLKAQADEYATLDMCVLDLFDGNASFIKNGACNTYIKNKKNISIIKSEEMPIGVNLNVKLTEKVIPVSDGDIILMCSDGLLDSKEEIKKDWVEEFLKNVSTNNVQKISDMILAEAIDNNYGVAGDDITVIVAKILKKK